MIIKELQNRGFEAEAQNTLKNGVELEGIRIMSGSNIAPVIYTDELIERAEKENRSLDVVVSAIINIYESNKSFDFDVDSLLNKDFILDGIYIGLQKESSEDIVKKSCEFEGIECYLYIRGKADEDGNYSIKVSRELLERAGVSESEAWEKAEANTNAETSLESMAEALASIMGIEYNEEMDDFCPFYVISNKCKVKGASSILNRKVLSDFGKRYNTNRVVVLPSSVHEMLIAPYTEEYNLDDLSAMVSEVNSTEVDPTEQLSNHAYIINL